MKRKQAPQNINHGVPTGDSLDERLDRAQKELGPQVTNVHVRVEAPYKDDYLEPVKLDPEGLEESAVIADPETTPRGELLREAEGLITGDRNKSYGSPVENFQNTADLWTIQFGHLLKDGAKFTGAHVAQAMMQLKLARMVAQPKRDNYLDLAGYAACGWECEEASDV